MKLKIITEIDMLNSAFADNHDELEKILERCGKRTLEFVNAPEETEVKVHLFDSNGNKVGSIEISKED